MPAPARYGPIHKLPAHDAGQMTPCALGEPPDPKAAAVPLSVPSLRDASAAGAHCPHLLYLCLPTAGPVARVPPPQRFGGIHWQHPFGPRLGLRTRPAINGATFLGICARTWAVIPIRRHLQGCFLRHRAHGIPIRPQETRRLTGRTIRLPCTARTVLENMAILPNRLDIVLGQFRAFVPNQPESPSLRRSHLVHAAWNVLARATTPLQ